MPDITKLSARKINELADKLYEPHSAATQAMLDAGYHAVRFSEARDMAAEGNEIAKTYVETFDAWKVVRSEIDRRRTWQGNEKPIRHAA